MADFPPGFDFANEFQDEYQEFIDKLRIALTQNRLCIPTSSDHTRVVPMLAPQDNSVAPTAIPTFDLAIQGPGGLAVNVRFRRDNLYLIGYQRTVDGVSTWYELGREGEPQFIENSTRLGYCGSYRALDQAGAPSLDGTLISSMNIGGAIANLAKIDPATGSALIPSAIQTLIVVISEATRLRRITASIIDAWYDNTGTLGLGVDNARMILNWRGLSNAIQRTQNTTGYTIETRFSDRIPQVTNLNTAVAMMGIMLYCEKPAGPSSGSITDVASNTSYTYPLGQPLLEIFYVIINSMRGGNPGNLWGTIAVTDGAGTESIWQRGYDHPVTDVKPTDYIRLEGPSRALYAADDFSMNLALWDSDDPIVNGTIAFNPFDYDTQYDVLQQKKLNGPGSVWVEYVAISDGLYAQISVLLVDGNNEDFPKVRGDISTHNGFGLSNLFHKGQNDGVNVEKTAPIPLSRSVVAVPTTNTLSVVVDLFVDDQEIANGTVKFQPLFGQSEKKPVTGQHGKVEVRVTWM